MTTEERTIEVTTKSYKNGDGNNDVVEQSASNSLEESYTSDALDTFNSNVVLLIIVLVIVIVCIILILIVLQKNKHNNRRNRF